MVARHPLRGLSLATLVAFALPAFPLRAAEPAPQPKDHALFVGGDACIGFRGAERDVVSATDKAVTVLVDGSPVVVPLSAVESIRVERKLKLSATIGEVADFVARPTQRVRSGSAGFGEQWMSMNGLRESAISRQNGAIAAVATTQSQAASASSGYAASAAAQKSQEAAESAYSAGQTLVAADSAVSSVGRPGGVVEANALEVSCSVSVPQTVRDGFVLLVAGFREKPGAELQHQIHLEPVKGLGPKPHRVAFVQTGFPEGYVLEETSIHVFAEGQEVATNLSEKRVDITAADAMRYLTLSFITQHAKETLAAAPLQIAFPADFREQLQPGWLRQPIYLTVALDGAVKQAAADQAGAALDPYLAAVVGKFWFTPALHEGKPVESTVAFNLSDYVR